MVNLSSNAIVNTYQNSGDKKIDVKKIGLNPGIWRFIFKRSSIGDLKFLNISMAEDQAFLLDYDFTARSGVYSKLITYSYFKGDQNQLTNTKSAIFDLQKSINYINVSRKNRGRDIYLETIFLRQIMTGLIHGSTKLKIFCLKKFVWALLHLGNQTSVAAFINVFSPSKRNLLIND